MTRQMFENQKLGIEKCPTGIHGLDEITMGGLPRGRPTLVSGGAGSGKTLLGMEFIVRGITQFDEPGVFMCFEENIDELTANVASLGMDLQKLMQENKLIVDYLHIERSEIEETGEYDLEGLFVRINGSVESIGAKRIVLDTVETLFSGFSNEAILRAELRRLFRWLKSKGLTTIITGEKGTEELTRHGLEEYVSDCVISLEHSVNKQIATRRLRVVKYRGSRHGTNEYPTLIDEGGLSVLPISSLGLTYPVTTDRVLTGIAELDTMLGGKGFYRGSSILISGTAGTGKSSITNTFAASACGRGERCLYVSFEESADQIARNMSSIGLDLHCWIDQGLLQFHSVRPTIYGLEMHLVMLHKLVEDFQPAVVVIDPITSLGVIGESNEIKVMLTRMVDFLKNRKITALFTCLMEGSQSAEQGAAGISSLIDSWLFLKNVETDGDSARLLYILKSRGMAHSSKSRQFLLTDRGVQFIDPSTGKEY
jgi:circadian clock protein KaiC